MRVHICLLLPVLTASLIVGLVACNTKDSEPLITVRNHVFIVNYAFRPETLRVAAGDTVTWVNEATTDHTATGGRDGVPDGQWESSVLAPGDSFARVFTDVGTFPYYCTYHWDKGMQGVISVTSRPTTIHVRIQDYSFSPDSLFIHASDTIVWVNDGADIHTSTSGVSGAPDGLWDSGTLNHNDSFVRVFPDTGSFPYYCLYHYMAGMEGRIFVRSAK